MFLGKSHANRSGLILATVYKVAVGGLDKPDVPLPV